MRGFQKSLLPLTSSKILSLDNSKKTSFFLVLSSLNRIIDIRLRYFRSTIQKKTSFFLVLSSLNRIIDVRRKATGRRRNVGNGYFRSTIQKKTSFFLVLSSLNRTFAGRNQL